MNIEKYVINHCDDEAVEDIKWFNEIIEEKLRQSKESYIGANEVKIYINDTIGFISLKKHKYQDYNKTTLIFGMVERDEILKQGHLFDTIKFIKQVENRISKLVLNKFRESRRIKATQKENKRKRIPISIEEYIIA